MKKLILALLLVVSFPLYPTVARATVAACDGEARYTGNGSTTIFVYPCKILSSSDLKVLVNGVTQVLATHYTVTGVGSSSGGSVDFITAPGAAVSVTILRNQPVSQLTNYVANSAYNATNLMRDLDKQAMIDQMQQEMLTRTLRAPEPEGLDMTLPSKTARANKILAFDSNGLPVAQSALTTETGATLVTTPEGNTQRSLSVRFGEVINPRDHGAVGDGATDDTTAMQAAFTACAGQGRVYIPEGVYKITAKLTVPSGCTIEGAGSGTNWTLIGLAGVTDFPNTKIKWAGATNGIMVELPALTHDSTLKRLLLDTDNISGVTTLKLISVIACSFEDLVLQRPKIGIDWVVSGQHSFYNNFKRLTIMLPTESGISFTGEHSPILAITANSFYDVIIRNPIIHGIKFVRGVDNNNFYNTTIQGDTSTMVGIEYNTDSPASNREVYENNFYGLIMEVGHASAFSVLVNSTTAASMIWPMFVGGAAGTTYPVLGAGGKLMWRDGVADRTVFRNLDVGTAPSAIASQADIEASNNAAATIAATSYGTGVFPTFSVRRARGTRLLPTAVQSTDELGRVQFAGHSGASVIESASFRSVATENFSGTAAGATVELWTTPDTTITPTRRFSVRGNGKFEMSVDGFYNAQERSTTPALPTDGVEANWYIKSNKIIFQFNDGGTVRYKYLDLTGTGVTWVADTTAP